MRLGAEGALPLDDAPVALAAGDVGGPGDEVAFLQGFAGEVGGDALAELGDAADGLVAEDERGGDREVAVVEVDVGAADAAVDDLGDEGAGLGEGTSACVMVSGWLKVSRTAARLVVGIGGLLWGGLRVSGFRCQVSNWLSVGCEWSHDSRVGVVPGIWGMELLSAEGDETALGAVGDEFGRVSAMSLLRMVSWPMRSCGVKVASPFSMVRRSGS